MSVTRSSLGRCPDCGVEIPGALLLIEYESAGDRARYAECPSCGDVVHPHPDD